MAITGLLRRTPSASATHSNSTPDHVPSSSKPGAFFRRSKTQTLIDTAGSERTGDLLYPTNHSESGKRASHYSTTSVEQGIGEAPSRAPSSSSRRPSLVAASSPSVPQVSAPAETAQVNQYDRLFGLSRSASTSARPSPSHSPAAQSSLIQSTSQTERPSSTTAAPLLRRKSTKSRYPPASASTGTSSSHRDTSTTTLFRRPSLRRREPSTDSLTPRTAHTASTSASPAIPASATAMPSAAVAPTEATKSSNRLSRFFGRRKSISGPISTSTCFPDPAVEPIPSLKDAFRTSPPLAVIAAGWQDPAAATTATSQIQNEKPKSLVAGTPRDESKLDSTTDDLLEALKDSAISKSSSFAFPSRGSDDSAVQKEYAGAARKTKHSTSRSVPLASMTISRPMLVSTSASPDLSEHSSVPAAQRRPSKPGRDPNHRRSRSLSMIGALFGFDASPAEPLPESAATLYQKYASGATAKDPEPSTANHSRRPSLRSRLNLGRKTADSTQRRPTTPEIESWKQLKAEEASATTPVPADEGRMSRASIDALIRSKPAEVMKITRSKSMIRRKPAPEVKQEEIDSSSSTPVYGRTFRALEVDHAGSPLGGSPASSPETQPAMVFSGSVSDLESSPKLKAKSLSRPQEASTALHGLGLSGADTSVVPSIDVRSSTPVHDAPAADILVKTAPMSSRLSSGVHSAADLSLSVDRPWSLISAGEADTPLLKLRKLEINTAASDVSHGEDGNADTGLFFRPLPHTGESKKGSPVETEEPRSNSEDTARSDTKIASPARPSTDTVSALPSTAHRRSPQAKRISTASRTSAISVLSSTGSALEAEVGQARRADIVALGKGRVKDWVADRPPPTAEAPMLSRSGTLRKLQLEVDEREARKQKEMHADLSRRLMQLSDALSQPQSTTSHEGSPQELSRQASSTAAAPRFARLSAFHDRKPVEAVPSAAVLEEAIRLGRAPSKRVRRDVSEVRSAGEAVMVTPVARQPMQRSASASATVQKADLVNPTLVPTLTSAPMATFATSYEAARAKQQYVLNREAREAEKELKQQLKLQAKYAKKKQADPLLAARLALAGLQTPPPEPCEVAKLQLPKPVRTGSVLSFHTAIDLPSPLPPTEIRPDTSGSLDSTLASDFAFPVPPQRMSREVSDDGTLLSCATLQAGEEQGLWRERRHYLTTPRTPQRDSSLRHAPESELRRAKSVGSSRDVRRIAKEMRKRDAELQKLPIAT